jgi:hypothetical protein
MTVDQTSDLIRLFGKVTDLLHSLRQWNEQLELGNPDYCYEMPALASTPLIPITSYVLMMCACTARTAWIPATCDSRPTLDRV